MKNIRNLQIITIALSLFLIVPVSSNDISLSNAELNSIEDRVNEMNFSEMNKRVADLESEKNALENQVANSGSTQSIRQRLAEINAELSVLQKALLAVAGLGALSAISSDGYNDNVPPIITILGGASVTSELGTSYADAGATAFDAFHGDTPVVSSGSVNSDAVGTYTITYTATDKSGNTATASRIVSVVDTTLPVVTVTGENPATVELGTTYTDAGATVSDI